jgi:hypothetical protein
MVLEGIFVDTILIGFCNGNNVISLFAGGNVLKL